MSFVQTPLLDVHYLTGGPASGSPLLLLHGWPDDPTGWERATPPLEAAGYRWYAPWLRGFGPTRFRSSATLRDGSTAAIAQDAIEMADALGIDRFAVIGHDWGGRAAYALAALVPDRISTIAALAIGYTPRGRYEVPSFEQSRRWWYQWLTTSAAGAAKIAADPIDFARQQWETWSPPGWFDQKSLDIAARSFENPDWLAITLHGYRHRWQLEPLDLRYSEQRARIDATEKLAVPTLLIQGGDDRCDPASETENQEQWFAAGYERHVINRVGHFPAREAPDEVGEVLISHLARFSANRAKERV